MRKVSDKIKLVVMMGLVMSFLNHCNLWTQIQNKALTKSTKISKENCSLSPDPGPCRARMEGFYFDQKSKSCRTFSYGGCQGSLPFKTMEDCESTCK